MNARRQLVMNNNVVESDSDDECDECDEYSGQTSHSGGTVYMSADSDPNVTRISTWK